MEGMARATSSMSPRTRSGRKVSYTISPVRKSYRAEPLDRMTGALMGTLRAWGAKLGRARPVATVKMPPWPVK